GRLRSPALRAEPVQDRHAQGADDVPVGPSAGARLLELEAELAAVPSCLLEQLRTSGRTLERRTRPAAAELELRAGRDGLERGEDPLDPPAVFGPGDPHVDLR